MTLISTPHNEISFDKIWPLFGFLPRISLENIHIKIRSKDVVEEIKVMIERFHYPQSPQMRNIHSKACKKYTLKKADVSIGMNFSVPFQLLYIFLITKMNPRRADATIKLN